MDDESGDDNRDELKVNEEVKVTVTMAMTMSVIHWDFLILTFELWSDNDLRYSSLGRSIEHMARGGATVFKVGEQFLQFWTPHFLASGGDKMLLR